MKFWIKIESLEKAVDIEEVDGVYFVEIDGRRRTVDCRPTGHGDTLSLIVDNTAYLVDSGPVKADEGTYFAIVAGRRYHLDVLDERLIAARQAVSLTKEDGSWVVRAPMPGLIVEVRVKAGDRVRPGDAVVVMEAMKMQNELTSEVEGIVTAVNVKSRDAVESQTPLIEIEKAP